MLDIKPYEEQIKKICIELQLKRLDLFGSATTENFGSNSDVDIIVEFKKDVDLNRFDSYFLLKTHLQNIFHRPIDIIIDGTIKNPYLKENISQTRKNIYAS
ncbi:nucleotidyltransferase domain-containing protein [Candidatus Desantisbacteria bacterium]|nr:nucleotidyltransferase domain-containing protein [Candidatus Desantisbacteria bacterium]MBI4846321.1 nucleotidyltransferase domain-containing protein [Candidatus Omnitrophota bacterium]